MSPRTGSSAGEGWGDLLRRAVTRARERPAVRASREDVEAAWNRVVSDCGCPDRYFCPASGDVECPRHGGFDVCCDRPGDHVPVPADVRAAHPRPLFPPEDPGDA